MPNSGLARPGSPFKSKTPRPRSLIIKRGLNNAERRAGRRAFAERRGSGNSVSGVAAYTMAFL